MARKPQNLILVTEHYPCSNQESFLETEIPYLARFFNVHVVTRAVDERMSRILPAGVTFSRPVTHSGKLYRSWIRFLCRMSHSYRVERRVAQEEGRWNHASAAHTLDALVESELLRRYIMTLPVMQDERPLVIYSANFNDYLYGLCRIKEMGKDIHVAARCHRANMFDPQTGERRETLNSLVNQSIDALYFTSEERRNVYVHHFTDGSSPGKYRVAPLGVPEPLVLLDPPEEDYVLQIVTCSPIEDDKRLPLLIEAMSRMKVGVFEWVHIGDGSQREAVEKLAQEKLGDKPGVKYQFLGFMSQEERYKYYAEHRLDVFLSVSSSESVPSAMLEAMANRIFVCATAVDGVTDVLSNETGLLMPENPTVEQLTAFLEMLCSMDKDKFAARAKLGFECWQQWFNAAENCMAFATELSAVENIQPDEPPKEEHRHFHSWKPEEQAAEVEAEKEAEAAEEAAEVEESEEPAEAEETAQAASSEQPDTEAGEEAAPAEQTQEEKPAEAEEPEEIPLEPRPEEPADRAARELLSMIEEMDPSEQPEEESDEESDETPDTESVEKNHQPDEKPVETSEPAAETTAPAEQEPPKTEPAPEPSAESETGSDPQNSPKSV